MKLSTKIKAKLSSIHRSFTNWFNAAGILYLQTLLSYPELTQYMDSRGLVYLVITGNVILRVFKTSKAIEDK